jgi:hypothetical protein
VLDVINYHKKLDYFSFWPFETMVIMARAYSRLGFQKNGKCRNPTLAKCGGEAQHLEKVGIGVLRDSRKLRRRFGRPKHLALGCSWCHWKGLET